MAELHVEVVYARAERPELVHVVLAHGATLRAAVQASRLAARYPEIDLPTQVFGIFGEKASPNTILEDGDRVEIYRPLVADPKQARRKRAITKA